MTYMPDPLESVTVEGSSEDPSVIIILKVRKGTTLLEAALALLSFTQDPEHQGKFRRKQ